jgi:DNA replication protein DnaC
MRDMNDALDYVRRVFPEAGAKIHELASPMSSYYYAQQSELCQDNCPGEDKCKCGGAVSQVFMENYRDRRVFLVRACSCRKKREAAEQKRLQSLLAASRIPPELAACTFENYRPQNDITKAAKNLAMFAAEKGDSILLSGPPGVGKTHLAVAIVNHAISSGRSAVFVPVVNLLDEMKDAVIYGRINNMLEALRDAECLALDDLGMQKDTEWVGERLYELVNDRYTARKQLIITTNARDRDDLGSMIGKSGRQIASRLKEITTAININGSDYRERKKSKNKQLDLEAV